MTNRKCKRCNSTMLKSSLESNDIEGIHIHWLCMKSDKHPYFCEQEAHWID